MDVSSLHIGSVRFTNALPLDYYLSDVFPENKIVQDVPSRLAEKLQRGELDVALLSTIELLRHPEYTFIQGCGVSSHGPVESVCYFSKVAPEKVETVALDTGSLSSVTMARILFEHHWKNQPEYIDFTPPLENAFTIAKAAISIGDTTLEFDPSGYNVWDMGQAWKEFASLPFVYAVWICREGIDATSIQESFLNTRDKGLANIETLAHHAASGSRRDESFYRDYFTKSIDYVLAPQHLDGMRLFFEHASALSLNIKK